MKFPMMALLALLALGASANWNYRWPGTTPEVHECKYERTVRVAIADGVGFTVACADGAKMSEWVAAKCQAWFKVRAAVKDVSFTGAPFPKTNGYTLAAKGKEIAITAATAEGVRYAMSTLRQLARPAFGTLTVKEWEVPQLAIRDWSERELRVFHLCAFPEISRSKLEQLIRMAAYYKFNCVVLDTWGTYRSEKHPWYGFREGTLTLAECSRLAGIARDLGVTLVPQINCFGHANAARQFTGKGAVLYHAPEYAPLFEPGDGWSWCLSNPAVLKVQQELLEEIYTAFGRPGWIHFGGEVCAASCAVCNAADYPKLVQGHLGTLCAKATAMGARPMLWGNMVNAKGLLPEPTLPKELVLLTERGLGRAGITGTVTAPWDRVTGNIFTGPARSAWGGKPEVAGRGSFAYHLRQVSGDTAGGDGYAEQGWYTDQVRSESPNN